MKKLMVNKGLCIGCTACCQTCEEYFAVADDGLAEVKKDIEGETPTIVLDAMDSCPTNAISIEE